MLRHSFTMVLIALISGSLWAQKSAQLDLEKSLKNKKECEFMAKLDLIRSPGPHSINCQLDNMHYSSDVFLNSDPGPVRIGSFNLLHPGTDKTLFKDFALVAELINDEFDLMAGLEFMDVVASPREKNSKLLSVINKKMEDLKSLQSELEAKKAEFAIVIEDIRIHSIPGFTILKHEFGKEKRLTYLKQYQAAKEELEKVISSLEEKLSLLDDLKVSTRHYRIPGYLKILEELRKLDPSWSLIVSPHGDALVETNAQELVGYYYRATKVKVDKNIHCSNKFEKVTGACIPNFEGSEHLFSRRPFLGTFSDGKESFSVLAAHVIFESPENPETQKNMLEKTFNVSSLAELPTGINKHNYARFIEVYQSLLLIEKLRQEGLEKVIYMGDLNLESVNPFWKFVFERFRDSKLLVNDKTSLSEIRFSKGQETNGVSSNYDHFIISDVEESFCKNASVVNFMQNNVSEKIRQKYLVRSEGEQGPYELQVDADAIITQRVDEMLSRLNVYNFSVSSGLKISEDKKSIDEDLLNLKLRVFDSQTSDDTYYKFYIQLISDHLPIKIECQF